MIAIHFLRGFISDEPGSWSEAARFITESAPVFFFIAFGMTVMRTSGRTGRLRCIFELGIIALFHQVYQDAVLTFQSELFLFLLLAFLISTVFHKLFAYRWIRLILAAAITIANLFIGHENMGVCGNHPFGIMPWIFFVIVGMMIGTKPIEQKEHIPIVADALALFVIGLAVNLYGLRYGMHYLHATISKWEPTTSSYMLIWTSIALCVYVLFNRIRYNPNSSIAKIVTISSKMLLAGVVVHYITSDFAIYIMNSGGFGVDNYMPWYLAAISLIAIYAGVYFVLLSLSNIKQIVLENIKREELIYKSVWYVLVILAIASLALLYTNPDSVAPGNIAKVGMLIAAFMFLTPDYDELSEPVGKECFYLRSPP